MSNYTLTTDLIADCMACMAENLEMLKNLDYLETQIAKELYDLYSDQFATKGSDYGTGLAALKAFIRAMSYNDSVDIDKINNLMLSVYVLNLNCYRTMITHSYFQEFAWEFKKYEEIIDAVSEKFENETKTILNNL